MTGSALRHYHVLGSNSDDDQCFIGGYWTYVFARNEWGLWHNRGEDVTGGGYAPYPGSTLSRTIMCLTAMTRTLPVISITSPKKPDCSGHIKHLMSFNKDLVLSTDNGSSFCTS